MNYYVIGIIVIVVLLFLVAIGIYNKLVRLRNDTEEAFATMDVYLKKRYDLIPNLVETVKGYAKHESSTLEKVIAARNMAVNTSNVDESIDANNQLSGALKTLFAVAEGYPDLKANQNFIDLQNQLNNIENDIAQSRKYFNATVLNYNNKIETVPSNIIAGMFKFKRLKMFEVSNEVERESVKVSF